MLQGGTEQILFVKDGIRVSEFELQPGGVVPMYHHIGPHLLVAVSDLDIRSDVEGQGPMPGHFKSGDSKVAARQLLAHHHKHRIESRQVCDVGISVDSQLLSVRAA